MTQPSAAEPHSCAKSSDNDLITGSILAAWQLHALLFDKVSEQLVEPCHKLLVAVQAEGALAGDGRDPLGFYIACDYSGECAPEVRCQ